MKAFTPAPVKPVVSADALKAFDIRVGTISAVADVPNSDRLVRVLNLEPRRIRGELSEGMLFDIGYADGIVPVLAVPEREVPDGARAG
jgi:tRNA-binding EMAP/Myf-like protein